MEFFIIIASWKDSLMNSMNNRRIDKTSLIQKLWLDQRLD
jgi:hypothetical protein